MDVYGGGTGPRAARLRTRLGDLLPQLGLAHREAEPSSSSFASIWADGTGEAVRVDTDEVEVIFDGYLHHHGRASVADLLPELAQRVISSRRVLEGAETGIFNLVVRDKRSGAIHLANDPSGLLPLVHSRSDDGFVFASHLYLAARALDASPDLLGVASMISLGYTLGSRTYFDGIERLNPGELVTYRPDTGRLERSYPETYFATYVEPGPDLTDELWEALVGAARPLADAGMSVGVMLSEGFDFRLIAGVLAHLGVDLQTFTHGTKGTKGTEIVRELSARLGSNHTFDFLEEGFPSDIDELRTQLVLADNLHVPFWAPGSKHFGAVGVDAVTTGYAMDSTLGAHALAKSGGANRTRVLQRYREIVQQDLGRVRDQQVEDLAAEMLAGTAELDQAWCAARVRRFLGEDQAEAVVPYVAALPDEIAAEHARVRADTAGLASQVLHRYFLENRGRKYSFGQEQTLRINTPLVVPCYEPAFMRLMSSVPPRHRLHHRAYLRLLRDHLPDLARIRSGAHALPPTYPRLVLETSRFAWKVHETRLTNRFMEAKGAQDVDQLRMVLFSEKTARQAARFPLEAIIERGSSPINAAAMQRSIDKIRRYEIRVFLPALYLGLELTEIFDEL